MKPFHDHFTIVRPDTWSAGNAAGKYDGQPLKASYASYAEGLAQPALCPEPNLCTLSGLAPVHKPQRRHADADGWREDRPQSRKAGHQSRTGGEDIIDKKDMTDVF